MQHNTLVLFSSDPMTDLELPVYGEPHFIFADYDTDYYIRAISASENPIYNVAEIAELTYRALPDPSGIQDIRDVEDSLDIYTVTGLRIDTASLDRLPAGIYIVNGKKLIIN